LVDFQTELAQLKLQLETLRKIAVGCLETVTMLQGTMASPASSARSGTGGSSLSVDGVRACLTAENLDPSRVSIGPLGGKFVVTPLKYLGDIWAEYNDVMRTLGLRWVSAGKQSHWEAD